MTIGGKTTQPIGHYRFCKERPQECGDNKPIGGPVQLTPQLMQLIAAINVQTNMAIKPESDQELYGVEERWTYPNGAGDCEDYVLEKRKLLHEAGISLSDLLITVVKKPDGEGHAVLTLRSTIGDFILDNLNWRIKPWRESSYRFMKRQSVSNSGVWDTIEDGSDVLVAAVKE
ncbi:transglutaminase-like cysteine peptidase [Mangrovibrevibacter kandeliae]|uniref:transglutaminase-like cysteine peptidase n=1 Tax=Mangrovibrevibacter kandeliae TaxID=2968473 RepID=UPI002119B312|nr:MULTISPECIES: transglutaminase-like cysteine peptidase [unclassified Aurantimonas]MCQ8780595.1 transglutaminase-like cysteine peptidase [Aurantimonas sp. CSK15Z-1]MCW4113376.1 transglutaminase-like cysteine peptidase [Aurantimonas sp. MSK8Z-1]